jgi:hypothetical protein
MEIEFYICIDSSTDILYNWTLPTHTRGAHTMLGSVILLNVYTAVQSLYACTVNLF